MNRNHLNAEGSRGNALFVAITTSIIKQGAKGLSCFFYKCKDLKKINIYLWICKGKMECYSQHTGRTKQSFLHFLLRHDQYTTKFTHLIKCFPLTKTCSCHHHLTLEYVFLPKGTSDPLAVTSHYLWLPFPLPRAAGHESRSFRLYPSLGIAGMCHPISLDPFDGWVIFHCMGFVYLFICWVYWGCFQFVAVVDNGVVYNCEQVVWGLWTGLLTPTWIPCIIFELLSLYFHIKLLMACLIFKA